MKKNWIILGIATMLLISSSAYFTYAQTTPAKEVKQGKNEIKEGSKEVARGTKKTAKGVAHKTKKAAKTGTMEKKTVKAIPEGFQTVTPFIVVKNAESFIEFLTAAFNGKLTYITKDKNKMVMHATVKIGDSTIMIADEMEKFPAMPCMLYLYVEDVDATYKQALNAKGISIREPVDEFYGDRSAGIKDAWGNQWWMATHVEDVSKEEIQKRMEKMEKEKV